MVTGALVGAVQIDTEAVETDSRKPTFVHIWRKDMEEKKIRGPQKIKTTVNSL